MMWLRNKVLVSLILTAVGVILWKAVKLVWLRPKWIDLRQQGLKGNPYKPFLGDVRELIALTKSLLLTPINLSDDPLPRVAPYIYHMIQKYGTSCFVWIGPIPWLITTEPDKIKEVLTRYQDFHKPDHPITQILMVGLYGQEGHLWAKHRKIINPAFHLDKLKKMVDTMYESCSIMTNSWDEIIEAQGGASEVDVWPFLETLCHGPVLLPDRGAHPCPAQGKMQATRIFVLVKDRSLARYSGLGNTRQDVTESVRH